MNLLFLIQLISFSSANINLVKHQLTTDSIKLIDIKINHLIFVEGSNPTMIHYYDRLNNSTVITFNVGFEIVQIFSHPQNTLHRNRIFVEVNLNFIEKELI